MIFRNPVATTSIFRELKRNFEDVDLAKAIQAGTATDAALGEDDGLGDGGADKNSLGDSRMPAEDAIKAATEMLKKMPGIDNNNVRKVINGINCVADLASMALEQLIPLVGPVNAKKLFAFLKCPFPT